MNTTLPKLRSNFVLRVLSKGRKTSYELLDLHTQQKLLFDNWQQLQQHLEKTAQRQGIH